MMDLTHALTGAAIGFGVKSWPLAFVLGIILHILIDKIPHFWPKTRKMMVAFVTLNYVIMIPLMYYLIQLYPANTWGMLAGAVGSLMVDILFVGIDPLFRSKVGQWHTKRQKHTKDAKFIILEIMIIIFTIGVILLEGYLFS